jgi:putative ABC transport system permease protein
VLAFTIGVSLLTAFGTGLLPALQAARINPAQDLCDGARGATAGGRARIARSVLVVTEVALSLVLLAGATLLMTSFQRLQSEDPGFRPDHLLTLQVSLSETRYPETHQSERFFVDILQRIRALPDVKAAGAISGLPFSGSGSDMPLVVEGKTYNRLEELPSTQFSVVAGDYFRALSMPVQAGRVFDARDTAHAPQVVVVNEALAKRFLPGRNPLGTRVMLGVPDNLMRDGLIPGIKRFEWLTIVGVVGDVRKFAMGDAPTPEAYVPYLQSPPLALFRSSMFLAVRTAADPLALSGALRDQIWALDRDQPITSLMTMDGRLSESLRQPRFSMLLLGVFAVAAVTLSLVGIYGVLSYLVASRTREIGIRLALGAQPAHVVRGVLTEALRLVSFGVALGLAGSYALTRLLGSMLHEVSPTDPGVLGGVAALLVGAALAASYLPARRATQVEPVAALRAE